MARGLDLAGRVAEAALATVRGVLRGCAGRGRRHHRVAAGRDHRAMPGERILILGGTRDARELAALLTAEGHAVITSLAGVTENPVLPAGDVRRGGFGGVDGLARLSRRRGDCGWWWMPRIPSRRRCRPMRMRRAAAQRVPLLRLERPPWQPRAGRPLDSASTPQRKLRRLLPPGARVLLTIGRKELAPFLARGDMSRHCPHDRAAARATCRQTGRSLLERPPFTVAVRSGS